MGKLMLKIQKIEILWRNERDPVKRMHYKRILEDAINKLNSLKTA